VLVKELLLHRRELTAGEGEIMPSHESNFFENNGVVYGVVRVGAPGERTVAVYENCRYVIRIDVAGAETLDDYGTGFFFVCALNLFRSLQVGAVNLTVEIVCIRGAE